MQIPTHLCLLYKEHEGGTESECPLLAMGKNLCALSSPLQRRLLEIQVQEGKIKIKFVWK